MVVGVIIELISVMNDEACTLDSSIIDQYSIGHEWIYNNFGIRPKYAFQIDPFGHSAFTPVIASRMGFSAVVLNSI